jgi:hypothetical protein
VTTRTAFLVQRAAWDHNERDFGVAHVSCSYVWQGWHFSDYDRDHTNRADLRLVPVALFSDRTAAEREANRLIAEVRERQNPFRFGFDYGYVIGLPFGELFRHVESLGLAPPLCPPDDLWYREKTPIWSAWWDENCPNWTREQHAAAWELLYRIRFYEVTEIELED